MIRSATHPGGQYGRVRKTDAAKPDKHPGEQIMALDTVGRKEGFVLHSYEVDREKPKTLLKNTSLSNYQLVDSVDQLKHEMGKLKRKGTDGSAVIPIDHAFDIKGIGMVVLGVVKEGTVRAYDELALAPDGKKILVKSIQDARRPRGQLFKPIKGRPCTQGRGCGRDFKRRRDMRA